jgi:hypothetical protein
MQRREKKNELKQPDEKQGNIDWRRENKNFSLSV